MQRNFICDFSPRSIYVIIAHFKRRFAPWSLMNLKRANDRGERFSLSLCFVRSELERGVTSWHLHLISIVTIFIDTYFLHLRLIASFTRRMVTNLQRET